ncbi:hypothetical protein [Mesorhizobium sp. CA16]|uniref:hypothetical protein n=1 Tax=Mesorhizobium sp. CA16 TaxID=588496 RepID=UPI001CCE4974|nr:hypothetical protein [Mesorhizobium sp. CA16]
MKKLLEISLGVVTSVGGFVEVGSMATAAQAGALFGYQLIWARMATVNLEHLAGRPVFSERGRSIGYIEEIVAEQDGDDLVVTEFHIGIFAAFERLSASTVGTALLDFFALRRREGLYRIPWGKIDISDPTRPRLLCPDEKLAALKAKPMGK